MLGSICLTEGVACLKSSSAMYGALSKTMQRGPWVEGTFC